MGTEEDLLLWHWVISDVDNSCSFYDCHVVWLPMRFLFFLFFISGIPKLCFLFWFCFVIARSVVDFFLHIVFSKWMVNRMFLYISHGHQMMWGHSHHTSRNSFGFTGIKTYTEATVKSTLKCKLNHTVLFVYWCVHICILGTRV